MHPHSLRIPFGLALRAIATAITAVAITGCNLPVPSTEPTQTPGAYATAQKALQPEGLFNREFKCPQEGMIDYYNLCFRHEFVAKTALGGYTLKPVGGSHCILLSLSTSKVERVGSKDEKYGVVGFTLEAKWELPHQKCEFSETAFLNVSVHAWGDPPCRNGNLLYLTVFEHWSPSPLPVHGKCTCTDLCGNPPHTPSPLDVEIPLLPDRGVDLLFFPPDDMSKVERATVGSFTGYFSYEILGDTGVDSEVEITP